MSGLYGADVQQLRELGLSFARAADTLEGASSSLSSLVNTTPQWRGADADAFRSEWNSTSRALLQSVSHGLREASIALERNADEQYSASTDGGSIPSPGVPPPGSGPGTPPGTFPPGLPPGPGIPGYPPGGAPQNPAPPLGQGDPLPDEPWFGPRQGLETYILGDTIKDTYIAGRDFHSLLQARSLANISPAAASATTFLDDWHLALKPGPVLGPIGGVLGIVGGYEQFTNSQYDGSRGAIDRGMGLVSMAAGAGTLLAVAGALGPLGLTVVAGASIVAGAWALGNLVVDNWDSISGFMSDPGPYLAGGLSNVADGVGKAIDGVGNALDSAGKFIGGLFS